jgi:uncharacterized cupin superfamily protein
MPIESAIKFATGQMTLGPAPITAAWILEGTPTARNKFLAQSADNTASTYVWDCTAGKFNWFYDIDETICLVEGSVIIRDHRGATRKLVAGDTAFFPAGSSAEWTVEEYVRKIAFLRQPLPKSVQRAKRVYRALKRLFTGRSSEAQVPAMSPTTR